MLSGTQELLSFPSVHLPTCLRSHWPLQDRCLGGMLAKLFGAL